MKTLYILLLFIMSVSFFSCVTKRTNFKSVSKYDLPDTNFKKIKIDEESIFQIQVIEKLKFSKSNVKGKSYVADTPYRSFEVANGTQGYIIEETYLLLDQIRDNSIGLAIYFVTFPMLSEYLQNKYFGNDKFIYTNTFRSIHIGYWERKDSSITILFKHNKKKLLIMNGYIDSLTTSITIDSIAHPNTCRLENKKTRRSYHVRVRDSIMKKNEKYSQLYGKYKRKEQKKIYKRIRNNYIPLDYLKKEIAYIPVVSVIKSQDTNGIMFTRIPSGRKLIYSVHRSSKPNINVAKVDAIIHSKNDRSIYIQTVNDIDKYQYIFGRKQKHIVYRELVELVY